MLEALNLLRDIYLHERDLSIEFHRFGYSHGWVIIAREILTHLHDSTHEDDSILDNVLAGALCPVQIY
jgi:hypothetical protein